MDLCSRCFGSGELLVSPDGKKLARCVGPHCGGAGVVDKK
jgi:hypothetical protein